MELRRCLQGLSQANFASGYAEYRRVDVYRKFAVTAPLCSGCGTCMFAAPSTALLWTSAAATAHEVVHVISTWLAQAPAERIHRMSPAAGASARGANSPRPQCSPPSDHNHPGDCCGAATDPAVTARARSSSRESSSTRGRESHRVCHMATVGAPLASGASKDRAHAPVPPHKILTTHYGIAAKHWKGGSAPAPSCRSPRCRIHAAAGACPPRTGRPRPARAWSACLRMVLKRRTQRRASCCSRCQ